MAELFRLMHGTAEELPAGTGKHQRVGRMGCHRAVLPHRVGARQAPAAGPRWGMNVAAAARRGNLGHLFGSDAGFYHAGVAVRPMDAVMRGAHKTLDPIQRMVVAFDALGAALVALIRASELPFTPAAANGCLRTPVRDRSGC